MKNSLAMGVIVAGLIAGSGVIAWTFMGPHFVLLYGEGLRTSVRITEPADLLRLSCALEGGSEVRTELVRDRRSISVAAFWGPRWVNYSDRRDAISPSEANQHGKYFPATGDRPALFLGTHVNFREPAGRIDRERYDYLRVLSVDCASIFDRYLPSSKAVLR